MSEMIERVARALAKADGTPDCEIDDFWHAFEIDARTAIEAMREPTGAMYTAGEKKAEAGSGADWIYRAMIDTALLPTPSQESNRG